MKITDIRLLNICCVFILQFHRPLGLLYCFLVFHLRVCGKSGVGVGGKSQDKERSLGARKMCLGPGAAEDGNSLTLGSRLVCLLARRRQLPGAADLCDIPALISVEETGQSPQYSVYVWCFCTELNIFSPQWQTMRSGNTGWAGGAAQRGEARIVGDDAEAPEGGKAAQPSLHPRAWRRPHLSRVTVLPELRPPHPKLGISALTPRSSPADQTNQDGKWKVFYGV